MLLQPEVEGPPAACAHRAQPPSYTVHRSKDGRLYYCNHVTRTSSWLPPLETWTGQTIGFPYGWEQALQPDGKPYFINHLNRTTTFEDPRKDWTEEPPQPRQLRLFRHPDLGFGFVAGSEKPVIVRFVTEGGPSEDKLQPGDQILSINGEDVKRAPRDHVIQLVRACKESVDLVVCQPPLDNSARKSALLSAAKKAKLKSNPSRVRFAEGVVVNGSPLFPPSAFSVGDSSVPCMPNVLKVFLENGQTKSFKYDATTTVRDVVLSLQQKLCIKALEHFSLVVEHVKSLRRNKLTLLDPQEPLARIAARPGAHNLRCLFRVAFVPRDACELAQKDLVAFEYLYMQCCNDVVQERYAPELKYDIALRLAALHIHQHAISNNMTSKVTVKAIEREFGLERFVPISLMASMRRKELRKLIGHFLKLNHNLSPTGQKSLTSLQAKLYYLNIISELPSYGAKCFSTSVRVPPFDSNMERVILVSPRFGISQIAGQRNSMPVPLADIEQMSHVTVHREDELTRCVRIHLISLNKKTSELSFSMEERDSEELVLVLNGYYQLLTGKMVPVDQDKSTLWNEDAAPSYHGTTHNVIAARWSYGPGQLVDPPLRTANFLPPPIYHPYQQPHLDSNMNNMNGNSNGFVGKQPLDQATPLVAGVTMEQLLMAETEQHVAEMQELVRSSEQYLKESRHQHSDSDSDAPPPPGQLKHSDSLLLLTQGQKLSAEQVTEAVRSSVELDEVEPSESDTDSMSTPTNSPIRRAHEQHRQEAAALQHSSSSFGLHSPDNLLPGGLRHGNLHDLLKKLQEDNSLPYAFAEGTLYLDPDIIDLTMIPPPITPDEDGTNGLPIPLNVPPTPFADQPGCASTSNLVDTNIDELLAQELTRALPFQEDVIASELNLDLTLDLEAFLATVAVPPPTNQAPPAVELTPEEILAYIIPPPPEDNLPSSLHSTAPKTNGTSYNNPVIEYSTLPRQHKPGPFSCCGKYNPTSNITDTIHQPPPRPPKNNHLDSHPPPQLPPKGLDAKPPQGPRRLCHTLPRNGHMVPFALTQHNRDMLLTRSNAAIEDMIDKLSAVAIACTKSQAAGGGPKMDERLFELAKESLTSEARQLVTASKLLVKSASAELDCQELADQLATCLNHLRRMTDLSADVAAFTSAPLQTRNLVTKVRDVTAVFKDTLTSALDTREKPDSILLRRAESLASVLATLLRSLRVFSP